jgi:hypothetical protein
MVLILAASFLLPISAFVEGSGHRLKKQFGGHVDVLYTE